MALLGDFAVNRGRLIIKEKLIQGLLRYCGDKRGDKLFLEEIIECYCIQIFKKNSTSGHVHHMYIGLVYLVVFQPQMLY